MNYKLSAEGLKDINLSDLGNYYMVNLDGIDGEIMKKLKEMDYLCDDEESVWLPQYLIDSLDIPYDNITWESNYYDEEERRFFMESLIKDASHYLVMAHNCRWNGASGYSIVDSIEKALYRNYEATIYPKTASRGGKVLICGEYSHDVPTGATTSIIALTEREYEHLSHWDTDFKTVKEFAEKMEEKTA